MTLQPGQRLSHYRLVEKIGEGGMGVVWKAEDPKLRREIALKVLPPELVQDPERRRRLVHEARAGAAVDHPNIASVFEVGEANGLVFVAMEYVRGTNLRERLRERRDPGERRHVPGLLSGRGGSVHRGVGQAPRHRAVDGRAEGNPGGFRHAARRKP